MCLFTVLYRLGLVGYHTVRAFVRFGSIPHVDLDASASTFQDLEHCQQPDTFPSGYSFFFLFLFISNKAAHLFVLECFGLSSDLIAVLNVGVVTAANKVIGDGLVEVLVLWVDWSFGGAVLVPPELLKLLKGEVLVRLGKGPARLLGISLHLVDERLEARPGQQSLCIGRRPLVVQPLEVARDARGDGVQSRGRHALVERLHVAAAPQAVGGREPRQGAVQRRAGDAVDVPPERGHPASASSVPPPALVGNTWRHPRRLAAEWVQSCCSGSCCCCSCCWTKGRVGGRPARGWEFGSCSSAAADLKDCKLFLALLPDVPKVVDLFTWSVLVFFFGGGGGLAGNPARTDCTWLTTGTSK